MTKADRGCRRTGSSPPVVLGGAIQATALEFDDELAFSFSGFFSSQNGRAPREQRKQQQDVLHLTFTLSSSVWECDLNTWRGDLIIAAALTTNTMKKQRDPSHRKPLKTDWSEVAKWYDSLVGESGSEYHREVVLPGVLKLLDVQPGQKVLDLACGQGVLCRILQERGAEVTGIDAAESLIKAARQRGPAEIRYQVADARELSFLPPNQFDAAACVLAIQNIHPIGPVFEGAARALRSMGKLVIVMMHPCFRGSKETSWGWDDEQKAQYRRVDRYLLPRKTPIVTHPGAAPDQYTWTFHKPIESYVKSLRNAGLLVDAIDEWASHKISTSGPRAGAENAARKEIPMFMAIRAAKAPGTF
jgi:ubiquinone/menaquinone biosynthesis C-methylase UbiE